MAWSAISRERQIIGGVPFDLIKAAELNGVEALNAHVERDWPLPRRIIATLGECRQLAALHLLLASGQARPPAKSIGKLILHFADGTTGELPLHDNEPLRELRIDRTTEAGHASPTGTHLILTSARSEEGDSSARIRLFHVRLTNPNPNRPVGRVDVEFIRNRVTPVILGMTVETPGAASAVVSPATTTGVATSAVPVPG